MMLRGNERKDVFIDDEDRRRFLDVLYAKREQGSYYLYSYCLMDNHVHLVLKEANDSISRIMRRITTSYVGYFNRKYRRSGHLFQDRYKSENVESDSYLLTVIRYVHQNPEKAGIGKTETYPWSSCSGYLRGTGDSYLPEFAEILNMFSENRNVAIEGFRRFHMELSQEACMDVMEDCKLDDNHEAQIRKFLQIRGITLKDISKPEYLNTRKELIIWLQENTAMSGRKLAEVTGINRETIRKILANK
ncbi:REP element-mobilizing transposase RayT [Pelosinus propionicus DSM 13327]|uniref:REP element-mobilizing transposase RayT n=2 Tax=Pelosinus TaxID=365348 RepID=A0A1I4QIE3_9FIRM|nr:REP element-mobilizing transposase RayT [Pelosinus propionicus DSM 13327]